MADSPSISATALLRYQMVAQLRARVLGGQASGEAVKEILQMGFFDPHGRCLRRSERTLYRWAQLYEEHGVEGLEPQTRAESEGSEVLSANFLTFLKDEKESDPEASVPELIRRARTEGLVPQDEPICRTSVWRACRRLGLPMRRAHTKRTRDMRRFAYPHPMMMVLADGKHFRAGVTRVKRVALVLLDDATRFGLGVWVGTSESTRLFLQALHAVLSCFGLMKALFLDNGSGFSSGDTHKTVAGLRISLIHGTVAYPEGRGKIERFNQTLLDQCLRSFDGNPAIDPDLGALRLRLSHWLEEVYNHTPHESLDGATPAERFQAAGRTLEKLERHRLDPHFRSGCERRTSADNIVSLDGVKYEMPLGYAGKKVQLTRRLLEDTLWIHHQGREVRLHEVDLTANAYSRRMRTETKGETSVATPVSTAANRHFQTDFSPIVDADGGFSKGDDDEQED